MQLLKRILKLSPIAALCATALPALATNGMDMEGYGPISTAMGGVSQAIDHGTAAMAQNPATLALMGDGARMDVALGVLGPDVTSTMAGFPSAKSGGTSYIMPAFGYARRSGALTYGLGVFAQGGMGTEYGANTFMAGGSGSPARSELGVGRVILPLAFQVTSDVALGGSIDLIWAGLDLRMAVPGTALGNMLTGVPSGNLAMALPALGGAPWARIDFSDSNDFTGQAKAYGWAAKLGGVYKVNPQWTIGASYQFKTSLSDMKTSASGASISAPGPFVDPGRITVVDFQWPAMAAVGASWQATPKLLIAADLKSIGWSDVMKDFKMRFDSAGMGGSVSFALPQNWKDQTVVNLGVAYKMNEQLTLRAGVNLADNPIPDMYVNPLFPATVKSHYTLGLGYLFSPKNEFNGSLVIAPKVTVTSGQGIVITHEQLNAQLMYTHRF